jgi:hypothetical protein
MDIQTKQPQSKMFAAVRALRRAFLLALAVTAGLLTDGVARAGYTDPACTTPDLTNCELLEQGGGASLSNSTGTVNIYVLLYGQFGGNDIYATYTVEGFLLSLRNSAYEAIASTYTNLAPGSATSFTFVYNFQSDNGSQGTNLSDSSIVNAFSAQIANGTWPVDSNGIYVFVPDSSITMPPRYCQHGGTNCLCGWNGPWSYGTTSLKEATVVDSLSTSYCQWGTILHQTPYYTPSGYQFSGQWVDTNGAFDFEATALGHEINEAVTMGWTLTNDVPGSGNNQMGDFCAGLTGTTFTSPLGGHNAVANFTGEYGSFLLQPLRVNLNVNGTTSGYGYCVNSYGGVFWGQDFGLPWTPYGSDWSQPNYTGGCAPGQPMVGVSIFTSTRGPAHAVMCGSGPNPSDFSAAQANCHVVNYGTYGGSGGDNRYGSSQQVDSNWFANGDWDPGYSKGECGTNEYVAGIAQQHNGNVANILCCAPIGTVTHSTAAGDPQCYAELYNSGNATSAIPYDWDYGFYKAQCNAGQYIAGVSNYWTGGGTTPHAILCCSP